LRIARVGGGFSGYAEFYRMTMEDAIAGREFGDWLHDPSYPVKGFIAKGAEGKLRVAKKTHCVTYEVRL
jgi:hypothetical protein